MKPFLQEIAEYYIDNYADTLSDFCFVFPNKRSGTFFSHFLAQSALKNSSSILHPEVTTISDFVADIAETPEASRLEQLFILYHCYRRISLSEMTGIDPDDSVVDFNKFRFWGEVLLNDFTDVDKYMVDPKELFHNIDTLKEISADYLTDEQIEVIERYWGSEKIPPRVADFWRHVTHKSNNDKSDCTSRVSTTSFIRLWQVLHTLYQEFREELARRRLSYQGMTYRTALDVLRDTDPDDLPYSRYVFIGFNVLSTVEEKIFETLRDKHIADFFWDYVSPAFADGENRATNFLRKYVKQFPQPEDASEVGRPLTTFPQINVVSMPSVEGQLKQTSRLLEKIHPKDGLKSADLLSTAIVLPDETLVLPLIDSLPTYFTEVNVTMGYPLRNSPVASLISSIISMQLRAVRLHGEFAFFHEDVRTVLAHPLIRGINSKVADRIVAILNKRRIFNVPVSFLTSDEFSPLAPLFAKVVVEETADNVFSYLQDLCNWLLDFITSNYQSATPIAETEDFDPDDQLLPDRPLSGSSAIEAGFLRHYLAALDELQRLRQEHKADLNVDLEQPTIFHLVERLIGSATVRFEGMPLNGLQIMGMLETRCIDFDNIIIPSMNDRIYPRKHFSKSFIPPALRAGYGMATVEHQESISAYYFYRLISRAKNVTLFYDSRSSGISSGEPSRYINQLRYLYAPSSLHFFSGSYRLVTSSDKSPISILLSREQRNALRRYLDPDSGYYLSASAINKFINCPVDFILSIIEGYKEDDEVKTFMDESTYGTIVHEVVEKLYTTEQDGHGGNPVLVNRNCIKKLSDSNRVKEFVIQAINKHYLKRDDKDCNVPLSGDSDVMARLIVPLVKMMLHHELDGLKDFKFIAAEQKREGVLTFPKGLKINFKYIIDRIDRPTFEDGTSTLRIVDYKTGLDGTAAGSVADMFDTTLAHRPKAMLQLFLYANAFAQLDSRASATTPILPQIYSFRTIGANKTPEMLTIDNNLVFNYLDYNAEFMALMEEHLNRLFAHLDDDTPIVFPASDSEFSCKYCMFKTLCGRN